MLDHEVGPVFIFASGQRCGSTLLQRLLCSHPQIIIWGEHDGTLNKILPGFERLLQWKEMFDHQFQLYLNEGYNNFIPNMNPPCKHIIYAREQFIRNIWQRPAQEMGKSIWGFKEVLYGADIALALREIFPNAKIIHLTRNIFECFISLRHEEQISPADQPHVPLQQVWTRERTVEFIDAWVKVNHSLITTPGLTGDWVFRLKYETLVKDKIDTTTALAEWLGLDIKDFDMDVFNHKLYTDRHKGIDPRPPIKRSQLTDEEIALVTRDEILQLSEILGFDMTVS